jgi:hypothetical protein
MFLPDAALLARNLAHLEPVGPTPTCARVFASGALSRVSNAPYRWVMPGRGVGERTTPRARAVGRVAHPHLRGAESGQVRAPLSSLLLASRKHAARAQAPAAERIGYTPNKQAQQTWASPSATAKL